MASGVAGVIALLKLVDADMGAAIRLADAWATCHAHDRDGTVMLH